MENNLNQIQNKTQILINIQNTTFSEINGGLLQAVNSKFFIEIIDSIFTKIEHSVINISEDAFLEFKANNLIFQQSQIKGRGGFIFSQSAKFYIDIDNSQFLSNNCDSQGSIFYLQNIQVNLGLKLGVNLTNSLFKDNKSNFEGGVFYINIAMFLQNYMVGDQKFILVENCTFINNSANSYGGSFFFNDVYAFNLQIMKSTFKNNRAGQKGGAIYATNYLTSNFTIGENMINNDGEINYNYFIGNGDCDYGGAIYVYNIQYLNLIYNKFQKNQAKSQGGALYYFQGVNKFVTDSISNYDPYFNIINNNIFDGNIVEQGMGASIYQGSDPVVGKWSYLILNNDGSSIANNVFKNNFAASGPVLKIDGEYEQNLLEIYLKKFNKNNKYQDLNNQQLLLCKNQDGSLRYLDQGDEIGPVIGCQQGEYYVKNTKQCFPCTGNQYIFQLYNITEQKDTVFSCEDYNQFDTYFKKSNTVRMLNTVCNNCPNNAVCNPYQGIVSHKNYYNFNILCQEIFYCVENPKACIQADLNLKIREKNQNNLQYQIEQCQKGYKGVLCQDCEDGYVKINNQCKQCNQNSYLLYAFPIFMKLIFIVIYLMQGIYYRSIIKSNAQKRILQIASISQKNINKGNQQFIDPIYIPDKFTFLGNVIKINLNIYQILFIFAQNSFYLPGDMEEWKNQFISFVTFMGFPASGDTSNLQCLLPVLFNSQHIQYSNLAWYYIDMIVYFIICIILENIIYFIKQYRYKKQKKQQEYLKQQVQQYKTKNKYQNLNQSQIKDQDQSLNNGYIDLQQSFISINSQRQTLNGITDQFNNQNFQQIIQNKRQINNNYNENEFNLNININQIDTQFAYESQSQYNSQNSLFSSNIHESFVKEQCKISKKRQFLHHFKTMSISYFLIIYFTNFPGILAKSFQLVSCVEIQKGVNVRIGDYSLNNCGENKYFDTPTILIIITIVIHILILIGCTLILYFKNKCSGIYYCQKDNKYKGSKITKLNSIDTQLAYGYLYYSETKEYLESEYLKQLCIIPYKEQKKYEYVEESKQKEETFSQKFKRSFFIKNRKQLQVKQSGQFFYWEPVKMLFLLLFILISNGFQANVGFDTSQTLNYLMIQGLNIVFLVTFTIVFMIKKPYKNINLMRMQILAQIFLIFGLASFFFMSINSDVLDQLGKDKLSNYRIGGIIGFIFFVIILLYLAFCSVDILLPEILHVWDTRQKKKQVKQIINLENSIIKKYVNNVNQMELQAIYKQKFTDINDDFQKTRSGKYYKNLKTGKQQWKKVQLLYLKGDLAHIYYRVLFIKKLGSIYNNQNNKYTYKSYEKAFKDQVQSMRDAWSKIQIYNQPQNQSQNSFQNQVEQVYLQNNSSLLNNDNISEIKKQEEFQIQQEKDKNNFDQ